MESKDLIARLRERHYDLQTLPEAIHFAVPREGVLDITKSLTEASVDDLAFAIEALEERDLAIYAELKAMRRLHTMARQKGAVGAAKAVDAIMEDGE